MTPTCLIAEADPFIARLLRRFAEETGFEALQARTGQKAVELARQVQPAVIILEPELPGKVRGWEAYRCLRADGQTAGIPMIACSWLSSAEAGEMLGEPVVSIQKPELHYEDFIHALEQAGVLVRPRPSQADG
jgi:putative two-component system response regulator